MAAPYIIGPKMAQLGHIDPMNWAILGTDYNTSIIRIKKLYSGLKRNRKFELILTHISQQLSGQVFNLFTSSITLTLKQSIT